jgi:hypothetical protein
MQYEPEPRSGIVSGSARRRSVKGESDHGHLEATAVGDAAWRVSDASVPDEDVHHVVAFVEAHEEDVEVVWLRGATSAPGRFENLDMALEAIDDVVTTGEVRDPLAGWNAPVRGPQ